MGVGSGFGKSILFGEHFVVYGLPALAVGIDSKTLAKVTLTESPGWTLDDQRPAMPGYKDKKKDEQAVSIGNVLRFCEVDTSNKGIHIGLEGDLVCASGIGASAASCVALARALYSWCRAALSRSLSPITSLLLRASKLPRLGFRRLVALFILSRSVVL